MLRADEDMARNKRPQVDEGQGESCRVEDLLRVDLDAWAEVEKGFHYERNYK